MDCLGLDTRKPINGSDDPLTAEAISYRIGTADWSVFQQSGIKLEHIFEAAAGWKRQVDGISRPWLCWNVDSDWCEVQQRLVLQAGWTPLVGFDPRVGPPAVVPGAVLIDFNKPFMLPTMWPHFPLEFAFCFTERLAFWHADLLLRREKMTQIATLFAGLADGELAAVAPRRGLRSYIQPYGLRYWELIGCMTQEASKSNFDQGCGWWMRFDQHPSSSPAEQARRRQYYWDCGTGIRYWSKANRGKVREIKEDYVSEGHCTGIGRSDYKYAGLKNWTRDLSKELSSNYDLKSVCARLGISDLLVDQQPPTLVS